MTRQELEQQTNRQVETLRRELAGRVPDERVAEVGRKHVDRLRLHATIPDFIPLLVYRSAKEELLSATADQLHRAA